MEGNFIPLIVIFLYLYPILIYFSPIFNILSLFNSTKNIILIKIKILEKIIFTKGREDENFSSFSPLYLYFCC